MDFKKNIYLIFYMKIKIKFKFVFARLFLAPRKLIHNHSGRANEFLLTENWLEAEEAININIDAVGLEACLQMEDRNQMMLAFGMHMKKEKED